MKKYKEVIINTCFGGFGLSDEAYKQLIEWGIPVREYTKRKKNPKTGLYDREVIFDNELIPGEKDRFLNQRYWDEWTDEKREHPLLIKVVKKLGKKANDFVSDLKIVKIPIDVDYEIVDYDGIEHIAERHRIWK